MLLLWSLWTPEASAWNRILNVRHWVAPDYTRIVFDTSEAPDYVVTKSKEFIRIDFKNTSFPNHLPSKSILSKPGLKSLSVMSLEEATVRIEISLTDHKDTNIFKLAKLEEKPDRVVVDIELPVIEKKEALQPEPVISKRKDRIIVIDPGHGGDDPGAIGPRGTQEKDVVLKISRTLRDRLNKLRGYRAYLTRDGDYYVSFSKRLMIAREHKADLFLSIHADAAPQRRAYGASVYCLSTSGASTEAARLLAAKENLADIMGGSPNGENHDASDPIVLNMYQTSTINTSKTYGQNVLKNISRVVPLKFSTVQGAPFRVLKLPEIPSLLVETAYISNRREEKLLRSGPYQKSVADAIAKSVMEILPAEPPSVAPPVVHATRVKSKDVQKKITADTEKKDKALVKKEKEALKTEVRIYKVNKGDTLEKIAQKHGTTLGALLKLNRMRLKDPLYAGRTIKINETPVEKETRAVVKKRTAVKKKKHQFVYYKVKKGETLDVIARRNGTTIGELRQLNRMKSSDPLLADRRLKVPAPPAM
jgi:N-acetylmuramoyl-L-alanine amidase